jgi:hypothetical protein
MLKFQMIFVVALALGAVACDPLPVDPYAGNPRQPYPPNPSGYSPQQSPYGENRMPVDPYAPIVPDAPRQMTRNDYPVAQRTEDPNQVLSPYEPFNVIDIEGFRSGQLAKDPSNGKIFRIP